MKEKVKRKGDVAEVYAKSGYSEHVNGKLLCRLKNTGNGYIAKFPGFGSTHNDNYVVLDYSEANLLYQAMQAFERELAP